MATAYTPRLALALEDDNEGIDSFIPNWNKLDLSAGAFYVNDGVTPDPSYLYDGAQIIEKQSGKMYVMFKNGLGNYDKINTRYPYYYAAYTPGALIPSSPAWNQWGFNTFLSGAAVNSTDAERTTPSNGWAAPVAGIYSILARWRFGANGGLGARGGRFTINSNYWSGVYDTEVLLPGQAANYATAINCPFITALNAGDTLAFEIFQDSGGNLAVTNILAITLIQALPRFPTP